MFIQAKKSLPISNNNIFIIKDDISDKVNVDLNKFLDMKIIQFFH